MKRREKEPPFQFGSLGGSNSQCGWGSIPICSRFVIFQLILRSLAVAEDIRHPSCMSDEGNHSDDARPASLASGGTRILHDLTVWTSAKVFVNDQLPIRRGTPERASRNGKGNTQCTFRQNPNVQSRPTNSKYYTITVRVGFI